MSNENEIGNDGANELWVENENDGADDLGGENLTRDLTSASGVGRNLGSGFTGEVEGYSLFFLSLSLSLSLSLFAREFGNGLKSLSLHVSPEIV